MSDYHDADRPHYIHEDQFPNVEEQLNLIHGYVEHGVESFDDEDKMKSEISYLLEQSIDWRPAVHIYWCIWGIVQAVIDDNKTRELKDSASGLYRFIENGESPTDSPKDDSDVEEEEAVFDYIAYSSQKAQLFWSDLIKLGLVRKQEYNGVAKFIPY
jgi:choline kinase